MAFRKPKFPRKLPTPKAKVSSRLPPRDSKGRFVKHTPKPKKTTPPKRDKLGRFVLAKKPVGRQQAIKNKLKAKGIKPKAKPIKPTKPAKKRVVPSHEGLKKHPKPVAKKRSIHARLRKDALKDNTDLPATKDEIQRLRDFMNDLRRFHPKAQGEVYIQPLADRTLDAELRFVGSFLKGNPDSFILLLEEVYYQTVPMYQDLWDFWFRIRIDFNKEEAAFDEDDYELERYRGRQSLPTNVIRKLFSHENGLNPAVVFEAARAIIRNVNDSGPFDVIRLSLWFYKSAEKPVY